MQSSASVRLTNFPTGSEAQFVYGLAYRYGVCGLEVYTDGSGFQYLRTYGPCNGNQDVPGPYTNDPRVGGSNYGDPVYTTLTFACTWNGGGSATSVVTIDPIYGDCNISSINSDGFSAFLDYQSARYPWDTAYALQTPSAPNSYGGITVPFGLIDNFSANLGFGVYAPSSISVTGTTATVVTPDEYYTGSIGMAHIPAKSVHIGNTTTVTLSNPLPYDYFVKVSQKLMDSATLLDERSNIGKSYYNWQFDRYYWLRFPSTVWYGVDSSDFKNVPTTGIGVRYNRSGSVAISGSTLATGSIPDGNVEFISLFNYGFYGQLLCGLGVPSWPNYTGTNSGGGRFGWINNPSGSWNGAPEVVSAKAAIVSSHGLSGSYECIYDPTTGLWANSVQSLYPHQGYFIFDPSNKTPGVDEFVIEPATTTFNSYFWCNY